MFPKPRNWLLRYGSAFLAVGLAGLARSLLEDVLEGHAPYATFFLAIAAVARFAGVGPSLLALALGALAAAHSFLLPHDRFHVYCARFQLGMGLYLVVGVSIALLARAMGALRSRVDALAWEAHLQRSRSAQESAGREQAERAMAAVESRLQHVLDNIPVLVSYVDAQGCYRFNNREYERWFGHARSEIAGKHLRQVLGERAWEAIRTHVETALSGERVSFESVVPYQGGGDRHVRADYIPQVSEAGEVLGFAALVQDITERKRAEAQLADRAARFRHLMETANEGIWMVDTEGRIMALNERMAALLGYQPEDMIGRPKWDFLVEDDRSVAMTLFERRRAGLVEQGWMRLRHRDGHAVWTLTAERLLLDDDGAFQGALDMFTDVSGQKQAEEALRQSEERLRLATECAHLGFWFWDIPAGTLDWTPVCKRLFGVPLDQEVSYPLFLSLLVPEDRVRVEAVTARVLDRGEDFCTEYRTRWPDGSIRWISTLGRIQCAPDGTPRALAGVAIDITERKQAEEDLREADRRKDEFLATLAHELRNPLAPIRNAVQLLRALGPKDQELQWARDVIDRQVSQMARLVEDLLDVSRITRGQIELRKERVALADVVLSALETSRPLIEASGHTLTVRLPPEPLAVDADATRLAQVLANLLNNAAKYTENGGHIELRVTCEGAQAVIRVRDDGMGIPRDMLPRIFDMFTQVSRSRGCSQGGLGIGLTLVRKLVQMHGGTVAARSDGPGRGSELEVRLPLAAASGGGVEGSAGAQAAPDAGGLGKTSTPRCRVLVVDDNEDSAETLALLLQVRGHEVRMALDGRQAIAVAAAFRPAAVLLDIGLPDIDGYEVARRMRAEPALAGVVLIAQTGWGQHEDRKRSEAAGFEHHLVKPIDLEALYALLADIDPGRPGSPPRAGPEGPDHDDHGSTGR